jgi:hypothetical protein
MKKNNKTLFIFLAIIVAIAIIACAFYILLDTKGKINQGVFRTNDALITSLVTVEEKQENKDQSMISDFLLDLSQKNVISLLIPKESEINDIYIDNIKVKYPNKKGKMYITQPNSKDKIELTEDIKEKKVNIYTEDKENQYLVEIEIDNMDFAKDVKVPEDTKVVRFDGTLLSLTGMDIEEIMFEISFDLNILDKANKLSACSIDLKLPGYELANSGIGVTRGNLNDYIFFLKDNFSFNIKKYLKF